MNRYGDPRGHCERCGRYSATLRWISGVAPRALDPCCFALEIGWANPGCRHVGEVYG